MFNIGVSLHDICVGLNDIYFLLNLDIGDGCGRIIGGWMMDVGCWGNEC